MWNFTFSFYYGSQKYMKNRGVLLKAIQVKSAYLCLAGYQLVSCPVLNYG